MRALYKNETEATLTHPVAGTLTPGQSKTLGHFLADKQDLTLVKYDAISPVKDLYHAAPGDLESPLTGLSAYRQIDIRNKSGDIIEVLFNNSSDALYLLDGEIRVFEQEEETEITIESLTLTGSGEGPVYITGWRRNY